MLTDNEVVYAIDVGQSVVCLEVVEDLFDSGSYGPAPIQICA